MKKNVGTLTFHGVINHGAVLQAYALQKFLIRNGFESEIIDYRPIYFLWQVIRPAKGVSKTLLKYKRKKKFNKFSDNHLRISKSVFFKLKDFEKKTDCYDVVVCGSDQIWNKDITGKKCDEVYFQRYSSGSKKVAYAASAGANSISGELGVCDALKCFSAIGIREDHLVSDVSKLDGVVDPVHVVDPTLLLNRESYKEICYSSIVPKGKYIVSYEVGTDETREKYDLFVSDIKNKLNIPVFHIGDKPIKSADKNVLDIAPSDWLAFLDSSEAVITNSFHGTAFAVNFRKPLFVFPHLDDEKNVRLKSFLKAIDMINCFVDPKKEINEEVIRNKFMKRNYSLFDGLVDRSKNFLLNSLR